MIARLEDKGWLKHRQHGRAYIYSAARPQSVSLGGKVAHLVDRLFAGSAEEMVTALIEYRGLSDSERQRIRAIIDRADSELPASKTQRKKTAKKKSRGNK